MESADLSEPLNGSWEVYKDAFAPPQPSHTIRAWERAPVPAQAVRLQGQKIWKRTGLKWQRNQDKKSFDAAQKELEKDGRGARKKLRLRGAKDNVGDATWEQAMLEKSGTNEDVFSNDTTGSIDIEDSVAAILKDADANALQFIPRKRTNANHVITPRKPLRQTTLNCQAQMQGLPKSPRQSPEKPRRRKSMRKSIRKSISGLEVRTAVIQEDASSSVPETEAAEEEFPKEEASFAVQPQSKAQEELAEGLLNDKLNILFNLTDVEEPRTKELEQSLRDARDNLRSPVEPSSEVFKVPLNDLREDAEENLCQSQVHETSVKENIHTPNNDECWDHQPLQTLATTFEGSETAIGPDEVQSLVTTSMAKKTRRTSQRKGTRRSTRTTRASSVRADEQNAPGEPANALLSDPLDGAAGHESELIRRNSEDNFEATVISPAREDPTAQPHQMQKPVTVSYPGSTVAEAEESLETPISQILRATNESERFENSNRITRSDDAELEDFDISAQLTAQLTADHQRHHVTKEDFELPPVPALMKTVISESLPGEVKPKTITEIKAIFNSPGDGVVENSSSVIFSPAGELSPLLAPESQELTVGFQETLKSISIIAELENSMDEDGTMSPTNDDLPESSTPDPTTSKLVETISDNAQPVAYDHDDTDMLRSFLTRVKANKAAKVGTHIPKRKRSLPHSPLRLPLGETTNISPSPQKMKDEFDVGLPGPSSTKRRRLNDQVVADEDDTMTERDPIRRSGRTRLPVVKMPLCAPSHIPVRRLGQDGDTTVTLKRTEEKELAALTRVNTRKNKGGAQSVSEILAKKAEEREDPVLRQRLLKEVFDEKVQKGKKERRKTVVWAEVLTQYQAADGRKVDGAKEKEKRTEKVVPAEEKKSTVKVGIRSKIALGMAVNGTPTAKRKRAR